MHAHRGTGDHFRLIRKDILAGLAPTSSNPLDLSDLTTLLNGATSLLVFPSSSTTTTSSHTTTTTTHSATTSSNSTTLQTLVPQTPSPTPTPTPTPAPISSDGVSTVTSGTSIVYVTATMPSPSSTNAPPKSFLQNPALEGGVFTAVGIVVLILLFVIVTWTMRKRRRDRHTDFITFDPGMTGHYDGGNHIEPLEKRRVSGSSSGHAHGLAYLPPQQPRAPQMGPPLHGYYQPFVSAPAAPDRQPTPNPPVPLRLPYNAPPPVPVPPAQEPDFNCNPNGGASLTRKYSDRKPVPPLLPSPVHDPSRRLTLPQQFCPNSPIQPPSPAAVSPAVDMGGHSGMHPESSSVYSMEDPYGGMLRVVNH